MAVINKGGVKNHFEESLLTLRVPRRLFNEPLGSPRDKETDE